MKKLRTPQFTPHCGWTYEEPSTGVVFSNILRDGLVAAVTQHRINNGIPVGDVAADIEQFICRKLEAKGFAGECEEGSDLPPATKNGFTVSDVKSFGNSVAHVFKNGGVVSQAEATRRAGICAQCKPYNVKVSGCTGCAQITSFVFKIIGAKKTPYDHLLKQCGNCGCPLAAKVWITKQDLLERQQVAENMETYPDHCWMRQEPRE